MYIGLNAYLSNMPLSVHRRSLFLKVMKPASSIEIDTGSLFVLTTFCLLVAMLISPLLFTCLYSR